MIAITTSNSISVNPRDAEMRRSMEPPERRRTARTGQAFLGQTRRQNYEFRRRPRFGVELCLHETGDVMKRRRYQNSTGEGTRHVRRPITKESVLKATLWVALVFAPLAARAQEPVRWTSPLEFHTFSIIAVDPATRETGVAVTTRNPCVGNAVPWVRAGVGAVATQGGTRVEYGPELLDLLAKGVSPRDALDRLLAADKDRERRQVGVIDITGRSAQWTGAGQKGAEARGDWTAEASGKTYAVQGNSLVSPDVVKAVAANFEASEGTPRHLADRLIDALDAGQLLGGDGRHGETQSAAVLVADPRPGLSRRPDGQTVNINVCEHPEPVRELRRIYDTASETLGFRTLEQPIGRDVVQLRIMLHALGFYGSADKPIDARAAQANVYTQDLVEAVDKFRAAQGWQTTVPGFVDARTIARLWQRLEEAGRATAVRRQLLDLQRVR
jgi:uncharacterized Ntn-hydrolase superfamily protein